MEIKDNLKGTSLEKQKGKVDKKSAIVSSARKLFMQNGYRCTSMREIAKDANVNLALVNYYFKSKEILFDIIFNEAFKNMTNQLDMKLFSGNSVKENIKSFIDSYTEGLIENPEIPGFIFQEMYKNPDVIVSRVKNSEIVQRFIKAFFYSLNKDMKEGRVRKIENPFGLLLNIISMCAFPFIGKPIVEKVIVSDEDEFKKIMRERKKDIIDIFQSYISNK